MSDTKDQLTTEQIEKVGGGLQCTPEQIITLFQGLTGAYESLVDFTSHVIERISTSASN